jgi:hypothetical protein
MHAIDPLYSVCGFVGGLSVGMTGISGGSLMTPLRSVRRSSRPTPDYHWLADARTKPSSW